MRARMHQRSGRGACNAAGRPLVHALPCCLLAAPAASWGEIGYSTVLRVGPHLEIPTRVPYSASRAAGEPPAPGAKVFTENVRHLGSFIEKRPSCQLVLGKLKTLPTSILRDFHVACRMV